MSTNREVSRVAKYPRNFIGNSPIAWHWHRLAGPTVMKLRSRPTFPLRSIKVRCGKLTVTTPLGVDQNVRLVRMKEWLQSI